MAPTIICAADSGTGVAHRMTLEVLLATRSEVFSVAVRRTRSFLGIIRRAYLNKKPATATPRFPAPGRQVAQGDCQMRYEQSGVRVRL